MIVLEEKKMYETLQHFQIPNKNDKTGKRDNGQCSSKSSSSQQMWESDGLKRRLPGTAAV